MRLCSGPVQGPRAPGAPGLARTGTTGSHFSGDLFLAFSTANPGQLDSSIDDASVELGRLDFVPWGAMDPLYEGVVQAVEETVLNVLMASETMIGRDNHRSPGFPVDRLPDLLGVSPSSPRGT